MQTILNEDHSHSLSTPTRFLMECGAWSLTPGLPAMAEVNPFEYHFQNSPPRSQSSLKLGSIWIPSSPVVDSSAIISPTPSLTKSTEPEMSPKQPSLSPPTSSMQFPSENEASPSELALALRNIDTVSKPSSPMQATSEEFKQQEEESDEESMNSDSTSGAYMKTMVSSGRKRRIVFEGDDAEEQRKKFLERNRVAAYKCRQKKKKWMKNLETHAEYTANQNKELQMMVAQLREESMFLRNQLLTHGHCDCYSVQAYLRQSSAQLANNINNHYHANPLSRSPTAIAAAAAVAESQSSIYPISSITETEGGGTSAFNECYNLLQHQHPSISEQSLPVGSSLSHANECSSAKEFTPYLSMANNTVTHSEISSPSNDYFLYKNQLEFDTNKKELN